MYTHTHRTTHTWTCNNAGTMTRHSDIIKHNEMHRRDWARVAPALTSRKLRGNPIWKHRRVHLTLFSVKRRHRSAATLLALSKMAEWNYTHLHSPCRSTGIPLYPHSSEEPKGGAAVGLCFHSVNYLQITWKMSHSHENIMSFCFIPAYLKSASVGQNWT